MADEKTLQAQRAATIKAVEDSYPPDGKRGGHNTIAGARILWEAIIAQWRNAPLEILQDMAARCEVQRVEDEEVERIRDDLRAKGQL